MSKIKKLNLGIDHISKDAYEEKKRIYISKYEKYIPGGLWTGGYYQKSAEQGRAEWEVDYPNYATWLSKQGNVHILILLCEKINEIITKLNKL